MPQSVFTQNTGWLAMLRAHTACAASYQADFGMKAIASSGGFVALGLAAAAPQPWIDPSGNIRPQPDLCGAQCVDFEAAQLPTLFTQRRDRLPRGVSELEPAPRPSVSGR